MLKRKLETLALLSLIYLLPFSPDQVGYSITSPGWTHFVYMFFHAGFMHLLINGYALFFVYNEALGKKTLPIVYAITVMASFLSTQTLPTVGASAAIYAFIGININRYKWKQIAFILLFFIAGFILPGINSMVHIAAFVLGVIAHYSKKGYLQYNDDNHRITGRE